MAWLKAWQDERPGWTRRVRWYPQKSGQVRLQFEERVPGETVRDKHSLFADPENAQLLWDEYVNTGITGRSLFFRVQEEEEMNYGEE
jgi:hypothetical protein